MGKHRRSKQNAKNLTAFSFIGIAVLVAAVLFFALKGNTFLKAPEETSDTHETVPVEVHPGQTLDGKDNNTGYVPSDIPLSDDETSSDEIIPLTEGYLEIHFIDVGQGDATLIRFVDTNLDNGDSSEAMLVDAGDNDCGTLVRNYINKQGVTELKYFVCTHPDADHIGGAASVVSNIPITSERIFAPNYKKDTKTYEKLQNEISNKWYSYIAPSFGSSYNLGLAVITFIAPTISHSETNNNSIVFRIEYGKDSFLFVGDCEEEEELELLNGSYARLLDCDVLKVGHHGSKTASGEDFIAKVTPLYSVISCGEGNTYHHPHSAALNNLRAIGSELFRTDKQGSIVATTYGNGIEWNCEPCNDWTAGE